MSFRSYERGYNTDNTSVRNSEEAEDRIDDLVSDKRETVKDMFLHVCLLPIVCIRYLTTVFTTKYDLADSVFLSMPIVFPISLLLSTRIRSAAASLHFNTTLFSIFCITFAFICITSLFMLILKDRHCERVSGRSIRRDEFWSFIPTLISYWREYHQLRSEIRRFKGIQNAYIREETRQDEIDELLDTDLRLLGGNGIAFERFLEEVFEVLGYDDVERTKATGDQGVDLIVTDGSQRIAIQAKLYSSNVSNDAVQQAVAGMAIYNCDRCAVITNSEFTNSARELARANGCKLINGRRLRRIIRGEEDL